MIRKLVLTTALALILQGSAAIVAFGADFTSLVSSATAANQTLVSQIDTALTATDLATLKAGSATALATARTVQGDLQAALAVAPDDASRSRVQGVLQHINAAIASLQQVATDTSFDAARSDLNAARGEAIEALNELPPKLPVTGGLPIGAAVVVGLLAVGGGIAARRAAGAKGVPAVG